MSNKLFIGTSVGTGPTIASEQGAGGTFGVDLQIVQSDGSTIETRGSYLMERGEGQADGAQYEVSMGPVAAHLASRGLRLNLPVGISAQTGMETRETASGRTVDQTFTRIGPKVGAQMVFDEHFAVSAVYHHLIDVNDGDQTGWVEFRMTLFPFDY